MRVLKPNEKWDVAPFVALDVLNKHFTLFIFVAEIPLFPFPLVSAPFLLLYIASNFLLYSSLIPVWSFKRCMYFKPSRVIIVVLSQIQQHIPTLHCNVWHSNSRPTEWDSTSLNIVDLSSL
uniref:Uncharacterized protein n=1 Tax=Cacopsylla melanoneura TaxID=428564 RepID=A0A8D8Z9J4_9HEMI